MSEYFPTLPILLKLMRMYGGSPVLCTALVTLTLLSSWRNSPAPPWWLMCNKASVGQVPNYTAR